MGTTDIPSAGTRVKLSADGGINASDKISYMKCWPREGNSGEVYVGIGDVSATHGIELDPGASGRPKDMIEFDFKKMGVRISAEEINFDADNNGSDIDWFIVIED